MTLSYLSRSWLLPLLSRRMVGRKAIVAGATGSVGRLVVQTLLLDPRVDNVTAVVRKQVETDRAAELWGNKAPTVSQLQVDYPKLLEKDNAEVNKAKEALAGSDAFLTCLGVYSSNASEAEMDKIEGEYNTALASLAKDGGATRGAYLSGQGVKQPKTEGRAMSAFARAKGRAEESLAGIFPNGFVSTRPGGIFERPGEPVYGFIDGTLLKKWPFTQIKNTRFGITASDIAKAMVQGSLFDESVKGNTVWENEDLKAAARRYEESMPSE